MKITVIVPVYKAEAYIHRCVDSILNQTYENFDLLLVDDGSPDRCGLICDEYAAKDSRVYVIHQKNAGVSAARNAGIEWALSESDSSWITFIDSDDWIHRDYLRILLTMVKENHAQTAMCSLYWTDHFCEDFSVDCVEARILDPEQAIVQHECMGTTCCSKLIFKPLLEKIRFPEGIRYEDASIAHLLTLSADRVVVCQEKLYYYYSNPESFTRLSWSESRLTAITVHQQRLAYFQKNGYHQAYRKEQLLYMEVLIQNLQMLMHLRKQDAMYERNFVLIRETLRKEFLKRRAEGSLKLEKETMWAFFFAAETDLIWKMAKTAQKIYHKLK